MVQATAAIAAMVWLFAAMLMHSASGIGIQLPRSQDVGVNEITVNAAFTVLAQHYNDRFQVVHEDNGRSVGKLTLRGRVFTISCAYSTAYIMVQGPRTMLEQVQGELTGLVGGTCYTRRDAASDPQMAPAGACSASGASASSCTAEPSTQSGASASSGHPFGGSEESEQDGATEDQPQGEQSNLLDRVIHGIRSVVVSSHRRRRSPIRRSGV